MRERKSAIYSIIVLLFFCTFSHVLAADQTAQLQAVLKNASLLKGSSTAMLFTRQLRVGDTGKDVLGLQLVLKNLGYISSTTNVAGYYGAITKNAVSLFQQKYKSEILTPQGFTKPTGIVGKATVAKLIMLTSTATGSTVTAQISTSACLLLSRDLSEGSIDTKANNEVSQLQTFLRAQGYAIYVVTGTFGSVTKAALAHWQQDQGIGAINDSEKGVVGEKTRQLITIRSCVIEKAQPFTFTSIPVTTTTTTDDGTAPTLSFIATSSLSSTGVTITWSTNKSADTQITYGTSVSYGDTTFSSTTQSFTSSSSTTHQIVLSGLLAGTTYHYKVISRGSGGGMTISSDATFTTSLPVITASAGSGGSISQSGSITIQPNSTWSFTINPDNTHYLLDVSVDGSSVGAKPAYTFSAITASHTIAATFALRQTSSPGHTYYVATTGSDSNPGTLGSPFATLKKAAETVTAGDTVSVASGNYVGFNLCYDTCVSGTAGHPITFQGQAGATIDTREIRTPNGIDLDAGANYIIIDGFAFSPKSGEAWKAAVRSVNNNHNIIRNNTITGTHSDAIIFGIQTSFADDAIIEYNTVTTLTGGVNSARYHGIYFGNSGDRPIIRGNTLLNNYSAGIHMNADVSQGGDGVISNALVEDNIIHGNGQNGASAINCDGIQDSIFQNNLLYNNHSNGIALYQIDAAQVSKNDLIINNTIIEASDARWAININSGSTGDRVINNILFNNEADNGSIEITQDSLTGFVSDYNITDDKLSTNGGSSVGSLSAWQRSTGQDSHSTATSSISSSYFTDYSGNDYTLVALSPAIDTGTSVSAPSFDLPQNNRPLNADYDIGAYEAALSDVTAPSVSLSAPSDAATVSGTAVSLSATASDNVGVTNIQFSVSNVNVGSAGSGTSHSISWDSTSVYNGSRTIAVTAKDAAQNASVASISVTVSNHVASGPVLSSISSGTPTTTTANITWSTNTYSNSQIDYGTTSSYSDSSILDTTLTKSHSVTLSGLASATTFHYRIRSTDSSGNITLSSDQTFLTATPPVEETLFAISTTPATVDSNDGSAYTLGVLFTPQVNGTVLGIRFYKATANTGTHVAKLYGASGGFYSVLLGSKNFSGETSSGWQEQRFDSAISVTAGTTYLAAYSNPNGHYSDNTNYYNTGYNNTHNLVVPSTGGGFNDLTVSAPWQFVNTNYWVDLIFLPN